MNINLNIEDLVSGALDSLPLDEIVAELVKSSLQREIQSLIYFAVKDHKTSLEEIVKVSVDAQTAIFSEGELG
jgi:hypothetical protein